MLKNKNQGSIRLLVKRSMKYSRSRNFFTVLAIILTTFMFTTVFTVGFSFAGNMQKLFLRQRGTESFVFLNNPTDEQIRFIRNIDFLYAGGIRIHIGEVEAGENALTVDYYDETEFEKNYTPAISDIHGRYPKAEDEVMLSQSALEELGIKDVKSNMNIRLGVGDEEKVFRLSGWYQDYEPFPNGCHIFVSQKYVEENGYTAENSGILSMSVRTGMEEMLLSSLEQEIALDDGQEFYLTYRYESNSGSRGLAMGVLISILAAIIILSGYLLIYNIMYISVTRDIRFYGLLKAIGTSPGQIRQIVRRQGLRLSIIGIPIGIALGTAISFVVVPMILGMFAAEQNTVMPTDINFHPLIYLGTILFTIATIAISCRKPAAIAGKVSPIEAMKYNGISRIGRKPEKQSGRKIKKKTEDSRRRHYFQHGGKPYKMAWRNIFREKKRAILVYASLFMGTMAYLSVQVFLGSMKLENYVNHYLPDDITVYMDNNFEEDLDEDERQNEKKIMAQIQDLEKRLTDIEGVESVLSCRSIRGILRFDRGLYRYFIDRDTQEIGQGAMETILQEYESGKADYTANIVGIDEEMLERYNQKAEHKVDVSRFKKGELCLIGYVWDDKSADELLGKTITMEGSKPEGRTEAEIASIVQGDYGLNLGNYIADVGSPYFILVSKNLLNGLSEDQRIDNVILNCDPRLESYVTDQVEALTEKNLAVSDVKIKSEEMKEFQTTMMSMNVVASAFSIVLILIGILNFINVMLTSVYTRRMELAVLESVGMTKSQIGRMLRFEGCYHGIVTMGLIMTIGNVLIYLVAYLSEVTADYAVFYYPWKIMLLITAGVFVICILVPVIIYKTVSMDSVTERLRSSE